MEALVRWQERYRASSKKLFFYIIVARLLMDLCFKYRVVEIYGYSGFNIDFNVYNYLISYLFVLPIYSFCKKLEQNYHRADFHLFFGFILLHMLPMSSYLGLTSYNPTIWILMFLYWHSMLFCFFYIKISIANLKNSNIGVVAYAILLLICISSIIYIWIHFADSKIFINPFSEDVYELRLNARSYSIPRVLTYIKTLSNIFISFAFVYSLYRRKYLIAMLCLATCVCHFSINAQKLTLFSFALAGVGYLLYTKKTIFLYPLSLIALVLVCFVSDGVLNLFRRVFFLPALIQTQYYDFFKDHPKDMLRQSFLRVFQASPYNEEIPMMMGRIYYENSNTNLTSGGFSDAYMNFGAIGLVVYPFVIAILTRLFGEFSKNLPIKIVAAPIIMYSFVLLGSRLPIVLVSGGFLATLFILYLLPRERRLL